MLNARKLETNFDAVVIEATDFRCGAKKLAIFRIFFATTLLVLSSAASAHIAMDSKQQRANLSLDSLDQKVLSVSHRLTIRNAHRCADQMPALGLLLHSKDQYASGMSAATARHFPEDKALAVQTVLPGAPAADAGLVRGATILGVNGWQPSARQVEEGDQLRLVAHQFLTLLPPDQPVKIRWILPDYPASEAKIAAEPACRVLVEVVQSKKRFARSNGPIVQISSAFATLLNDEQLAVVIAHELAHSVLNHRETLAGSDLSNGLFADFGRTGRIKREAEEEADRFSIRLLRSAGYDPAIAPAFWRSKIGRKTSGGWLGRGYYPSAKKRASMLEAEIDKLESD